MLQIKLKERMANTKAGQKIVGKKQKERSKSIVVSKKSLLGLQRSSSSVSDVAVARDTVIDLDFGPDDKKKEEIEYEPSEMSIPTE